MKSLILILALIPLSIQVPHCYIEEDICDECDDGYFLYDGKCSSIEHCIDMHENTCQKCEKGFRVSELQNSCLPIKEGHCIRFALNNDWTIVSDKCEICEDGYKLKEEDNTCELVVEHCLDSFLNNDGNFICEECEPGFAINKDINKCIEFPNCKEVDSDGQKCIDCGTRESYFLHPNKDGECVFNICSSQSHGKCTSCSEYFLS